MPMCEVEQGRCGESELPREDGGAEQVCAGSGGHEESHGRHEHRIPFGAGDVPGCGHSTLAVNPIRRVVTLLRLTQKKITAEGHEDTELSEVPSRAPADARRLSELIFSITEMEDRRL